MKIAQSDGVDAFGQLMKRELARCAEWRARLTCCARRAPERREDAQRCAAPAFDAPRLVEQAGVEAFGADRARFKRGLDIGVDRAAGLAVTAIPENGVRAGLSRKLIDQRRRPPAQNMQV